MTALTPEISVIVPVYNAEKYLSRCINSILAQSFTNFELLLIDDGSTDKSSEICDDYAAKDQRIKVFHKKNGGVSSARNMGLDHAKGKWITFVDSDDCIYANIFDIISLHDEDLLIFNYDIESNGSISCSDDSIFLSSSNSFEDILEAYLDCLIFKTPWSKFFKRNLISTLRFNTQITVGVDTLFVLQYLQKCTSLFVSKQKYYVWIENFSLFKDKYKLSVEQAVCIVTCLYSKYKLLNVNCVAFERFIYNIYLYLCENDILEHGTRWFRNEVVIQLWDEVKYSYSLRKKIEFRLKKYKLTLSLLRLYHQNIHWSYN